MMRMYRRQGIKLTYLDEAKAWELFTKNSVVFVSSQEEADYFNGMSYIIGKELTVVPAAEEREWIASHVMQAISCIRYYTQNPLDRCVRFKL